MKWQSLQQQFLVLSRKHVILIYRNWKGTLGQLIAPVCVALILLGLQQLSNYVLSRDQPFPPTHGIGQIPQCTPRKNGECSTLLYAPQNCKWVDDLLRDVAATNGLDFETDFKGIGDGELTPDGFKADNSSMYLYIKDNQNLTQNAIIFTSAYVYGDTPRIPPNVGYILFYNSSYADYNNFYTPAMEVMRAVDESVLRLKGNRSASIQVETKDFPRPQLRIAGYDVVAANGGVWFYIPPMIIFFIILTEIVMEKEQRLRLGMQMMGLKSSVYWITWFGNGLTFVTLTTLLLIAAGAACGFSVFLRTNFAVSFLLFFLYGMGALSLAFVLSTLISRTKTAQTVGYAIVLVGFVFQAILCSGYGILVALLYAPDVELWVVFVRWAFTMYPPFNLAKAYSDIAVLSSKTIDVAGGKVTEGPGFGWEDLFIERPVQKIGGFPDITVPPPINSFYYLILNVVVYFFLTWYFDNVLPGENGSARPFYFFLQPSYWGFRSKRHVPEVSLGDSEEEEGSGWESDVERERVAIKSDNESVVRLNDLTKVYRQHFWKSKGDLKAVDRLSFAVRRGEIFCLLGHNGAGKTTTINMLTGLFNPDGGEAFIYDLDIVDDIDDIRRVMGVCPQHDILWNELTAREHLQLFAKLKGLPTELTQVEIDTKLDKVGLGSVGDHRVGTYSGGMKRRLSVAIASIGNPAVIYMDEPSTGMDPVNRRGLWNLIQDLKKDTAIILTTHSMEEADTLGDRIGIMAFGRLRCVGNALHLKSKYGVGYRLGIITVSQNSQEVIKQVQRILPSAILAVNDAGSLGFNIPKESLEQMPTLMQWLESESAKREDGLLREWGMSHSTLEEVFLEITKRNDFVYDDLDAEPPSSSEGSHKPKKSREHPQSFPYRALILKNFSLQSRQKGTNFCQVITPILVMGLLLLLKVIIQSQLSGDVSQKQFIPTLPWPLNNDPRGPSELLNLDNFDGFDFDDGNETTFTGECLEFFLFSASDSKTWERLGQLDNNGTSLGMLGKIRQRECVLANETELQIPYYLPRPSAESMDAELFHDLNVYNDHPLEDLKKDPLLYLLPDGTASFDSVDPDKRELKYTFSVNDNTLRRYHRYNNFTKLDIYIPPEEKRFFYYFALIIAEGRLAMMSMIHDAFQSFALNEPPVNPVLGTKFAQKMPFYASADILDILEAMGTLLYPVALTLQLPIYVYILVMEKADRLRELMKSHGMKMSAYLITNYLFNYVLYIVVVAFFWTSGVLIDIRFFKQTDPLVLFLFLFGWGHALIALGFFFSTFLNSKRAATIVGYIVALIGSLIGIVLCVGIYGKFPWSIPGSGMPFALNFWPQFAFIRGVYLLNYACATSYSCYGPLSSLHWGDEFTQNMTFLYIDAAILMVLGLYLEAVLPKEYGVPKHPLFFLQPFVRLFKKLKRRSSRDLLVEEETEQLLHSHEMFEPEIDEEEDCQNERLKVHEGVDPRDHPLILKDLRKVYPGNPPKVAVNKMCLAIPSNECFGLLGENGAGKTTTISIATGLILPTSGSALVGGYDIRTEIDKVHLVIGVCPQFSVQWESLTVREHLLFYARLKGVPRKDENSHVDRYLRDFGLLPVADRLSSNLSGGMQRRLSVAIALVGDSEIVFMDEPTTGLDPTTRRQLWRIIEAAKKGRAIVLTTHSMEEAELLCSRIGIVVKGEMKCLGSPLRLKNKFADGYRLVVNFNPEDEEELTRTISKIFPTAVEIASYQGTKEYNLEIRDGKVSEAFTTMTQHASHFSSWSLGQIGLEDVFQKIVSESRQKELLKSQQSDAVLVVNE